MSKITPKQLYDLLTTDYPNTHYVEDLINSHFPSYQTFIQHYGDDADYAMETFFQEIIDTHQNLHIINKETAEILHTINLQNYAGEPLPPHFSQQIKYLEVTI